MDSELVGDDAVARDELGLETGISHLANDQAAFGVQAAPVDDGHAGVFHLGDQRREVLVADVDALIHDFLEAIVVHRLLGLVGKALAVRGLVVENGNLAILVVVKNVLAGNRALLVVATARAEGVPVAALGELRVGRSRRDLKKAVFDVNVGRRDGDAGVEVAVNELDAIADELVGNRNALLRVGNVVTELELDLLAVHAAGGIDVLRRQFRALLKLRAKGGVRAGQRAGDADQDVGLGRPRQRQSGRYGDAGKPMHSHIPYSWLLRRLVW